MPEAEFEPDAAMLSAGHVALKSWDDKFLCSNGGELEIVDVFPARECCFHMYIMKDGSTDGSGIRVAFRNVHTGYWLATSTCCPHIHARTPYANGIWRLRGVRAHMQMLRSLLPRSIVPRKTAPINE